MRIFEIRSQSVGYPNIKADYFWESEGVVRFYKGKESTALNCVATLVAEPGTLILDITEKESDKLNQAIAEAHGYAVGSVVEAFGKLREKVTP